MIRRIFKFLGVFQAKNAQKPSLNKVDMPMQDPEKDAALVLESRLIEVAQEFEHPDQFKNAAQKVASELPFQEAKKLIRYFHNTPPVPEMLKGKLAKYGIFGVWMNLCQDSIFEILFNYKEQAIPTLFTIGFGEYDWTQYKAIDVLCRLAKEGIQTEHIIINIGQELPDFRYEATFPSVESLCRISNNELVPDIVLRVFEDYSTEDPIDAFTILRILAINYPERVKEKLDFIKSIANGEIIKNRSPLLDNDEVPTDDTGEMATLNIENHRVNAALFFNHFDSTDKEIESMLDYWENNAQTAGTVDKIKKFRKNKRHPY